jgi:hypothetical protein
MTTANHDNCIPPPHRTRPASAERLSLPWRLRVADECGQALTELALVIVPLLVIVFGIVEFGLALNTKNDQTHLANEVARYAIVNEDPGGSEELQDWAKKQGDSNFLIGGGKICITYPTAAGEPLKVEATSTIKWIPALKLTATSSTLRGIAYMRMEATPTSSGTRCSK